MDASTKPATQRRIRRGADEWREILARFEQSGQTREQFCTSQNLGLSTFSRWRQRLREKASTPEVGADDAVFVELAQEVPAPSSQPWDVELQLGAGVCLRLRRAAC